MILPFDLPIPPGFSTTPIWDGNLFRLGDQRTPVLEYNENFAGWSDDLTFLHEEAAGIGHPIDIASRRDAISQIKKYISDPTGVILEIGCSSGFLLKDLIRNFPKATVVGSDVVRDPLYRLAKETPGIPLIRFDLLQSPLPEKSIDALIMLNVLEHIQNDVDALRKAFSLLKTNGILVIEVPAGSFLYDAYDAELHHFRRYSLESLHTKLLQGGFDVLRQSHLGFLLFPAFAVVKMKNKFLRLPKKHNSIVRDQAAITSESGVIKKTLEFELDLFSNFSLPFGIRALAVGRRTK